MKRNKRHGIKIESHESTVNSRNAGQDRDLDLAHYIHDRVELLQRAFGAIKPRELRAMTPACVAGLSLDDLQELCLEELLGISSVRLCAILDGAEPPSDTDSSESSDAISAVHLETISLDSISSDEETLNPPSLTPIQESKSGKHKKRCRRKEARKAKSEVSNNDSQSHSRAAERAGMTVLELLELQARARAIRAQLALEHSHVTATDVTAKKSDESDNDVQIKEEPPEVVELSSDESQNLVQSSTHLTENEQRNECDTNRSPAIGQSKSKCDLTVIVPNTQSRKIKLKRNKTSATSVQEFNDSQKGDVHEGVSSSISKIKNMELVNDDIVPKLKENDIQHGKIEDKDNHNNKKGKVRLSKQRKKRRNKNKIDANREGSDHDEITLQLSDTEKMDLLQDFDRKNVNNTSSSESDTSTETPITVHPTECVSHDNVEKINLCERQLGSQVNDSKNTDANNGDEMLHEKSVEIVQDDKVESDNNIILQTKDIESDVTSVSEGSYQVAALNDQSKSQEIECSSNYVENEKNTLIKSSNLHEGQELPIQNREMSQVNDISEGEISDRSSELKTRDIDPNISRIGCKNLSDEDVADNDVKSRKLESNNKIIAGSPDNIKQSNEVCEILEISDDSSCYEEEGVSVLSKEPTTEEIEAFSAKIDHEIQRELTTGEENNEDLENISWKHRYLDSKKVKNVMSTANILNALRKKNKELKRKIEESKNTPNNEKPNENIELPSVEEGTVDQYNTLEGSTKYVSPQSVTDTVDHNSKHLHKEMKKDAKQLLKMYKRLLKYNDMQKEPRKKSKKKKNKKSKEKISQEASNEMRTAATRAAPIPRVSNCSSVSEATHTPQTMSAKASSTPPLGLSPSRAQDSAAVQSGVVAFTVCL